MSSSPVCFLHIANTNPSESTPAAGCVLSTPPQARGEAFTHWCTPGMLISCCPYRKMWFQQLAKLKEISLLPRTHTLVVAWPSHHFLNSHQASSSTSIIQFHMEQRQKQPCTQQSSIFPSQPRQKEKELKMGGHGERKDSWSLAGKRVKTCCDNLGKQDVARSQMPTLFPHPDEMLSRLPTPLRFVFIFNKCKKIPKATL